MKKRNIFKTLLVVILSALIALQITGCGGLEDTQIQADIENDIEDVFEADEVIKTVEILERKENEEEKAEIVFCLVSTEDGKYSYQKEAMLRYVKEEKEWILDEMLLADRRDWIISPLVGIEKEEIISSLAGMNVTVNDEIWDIRKENISGISVEKQETDIEGKLDVVTVKVVIDDEVQQATGELKLTYDFDTVWKLKDCSGKESFTTQTKLGKELNVTDEMLLSLIDQTVFEYGNKNFSQEITLNKNEISDFKINNQTTSEKGRKNIYQCSCTLSKANAVFAMEIEIPYYYSESWEPQPITVSGKCTDVMITGVWSGSNYYGRLCEMMISEVEEKGNMKGVYTDKGDPGNTRYGDGYSYNVSGNIDLDNLTIFLKSGEIIGELPYSWFKASDITARINVDEGELIGNADLKFWLYLQ